MSTLGQRWGVLRPAVSLLIAAAVPSLVYLVNGSVGPWAFVLGTALGLIYWCFGPLVFVF